MVTGTPHKESEDATPASMPNPVTDTSAPSANDTPDHRHNVSAAADELPPLPLELGRTMRPNSAEETASTPTAAPTSAPAAPVLADELPPLPLDLGLRAMPDSTPAAAPAPGPAALDVASDASFSSSSSNQRRRILATSSRRYQGTIDARRGWRAS